MGLFLLWAVLVLSPAVAAAFVDVSSTAVRSPAFGQQRSIQKKEYLLASCLIPKSSSTVLHAIDAVSVCKGELLSLVQNAPSGRATPRRLTQKILDIVRQLERKCPTPDDQILPSLTGSWELLWTAQDPQSPETNRPFFSWIFNPLENQSYSNNPEGRSNPFLPIAWQDRLERAGFVTTTATSVRSTQAIDPKSGLIRNVVAVNLGRRQPQKQQQRQQRRASLTVTIRFRPVLSDPRRVNVKFESCRLSIPGTPIEWNFPLGWAGPKGWLRTVYVDETLRVTRGHKGSVFVLSRPRRASV